MALAEMKVCPKCGYTRHAQERAPAYECPQCSIIYGKYRPPAAPAKATAEPPPTVNTDKPQTREAAPGTEPISPASTWDAVLLSVAWGVLLEPVFGITSQIKRLGFPGDGWLSEVFEGRLAARFFLVEVGIAGTLLSIGLMALILFAMGAQRSASISMGRKVTISVLALNYFVAMLSLEHPVSALSYHLLGYAIWTEVQDATLSLTMVVFGVLVSQHLVRWSRSLQTNHSPEGAA